MQSIFAADKPDSFTGHQKAESPIRATCCPDCTDKLQSFTGKVKNLIVF
jgi:hypothetical protein